MKKKIIENTKGLTKKLIDKQINNTLEGRCIFLCYQPKVPSKLKEKLK